MPTPLAMRFCQAGDLSPRVGRTGVGLGSAYTSIIFTNRSSTACQLQGVPVLQLLDASGQLLPQPATQQYSNDSPPVALLPGVADTGGITPPLDGQAEITVRMPTAVCLPRPSASLVIILPDRAGKLDVAWPRSGAGYPGCGEGLDTTPFSSALPPTPIPTPPPDFTVKFVLPQSIAIGQTLKYEVRLTNIAGRDIAFTTCPGYTEYLKGAGLLRARYLLNCKPLGLFKSGETVKFAMELRISAADSYDRIGPGADMVGWVIDLPFRSEYRGGGQVIVTT